jgi:inner membrane transporter RhtA
VLLFARVEPLGVAWLRIVSAAAVFAAWRRPWSRLLERDVLLWGVVLAAMNCCFYLAIDRLPLGTVAAIEFLPVIGLAALGARSARNAAALVLAVGGVAVLSDVQLTAEPLGLAFAFANAALFAAYIVVAHRVASRTTPTPPDQAGPDGERAASGRGAGIDGLAAAMIVAAVVATPLSGWAALPALVDPVALAAGFGVGICSSVIPYVSDQLAMARLPRATYALFVALLPATATVIGLLVLGQVPTAAEVVGVALVVAGVAVHREPEKKVSPGPARRPRRSPQATPDPGSP